MLPHPLTNFEIQKFQKTLKYLLEIKTCKKNTGKRIQP